METHFAPAVRSSEELLRQEIELVDQDPVLAGLLRTVSGILAVLNEERQLLAVNTEFLRVLGVAEPTTLLGLRPGEALGCIHAHEERGGCGTSRHCATCGAAIAVVSCLAKEIPQERKCVLAVSRDGKTHDMFLSVRAVLVPIGERRLVVLFLQDITIPQQWAALERVFFHDLNNLVNGLMGTVFLLKQRTNGAFGDIADRIERVASRISDEISLQRVLAESDLNLYQPVRREVAIQEIFEELRAQIEHHPASVGKTIQIDGSVQTRTLLTDCSIIVRILSNMTLNALEASSSGDTVRIWNEEANGRYRFCVWNGQVIPPHVALRVFQRNFSTKQEGGRGLGTFSMKYFGEQMLGGVVGFSSESERGTTFWIELPGQG